MGRTVINIQETIGKTVGRRQPPKDSLMAGFEHQAALNEWVEAFGHRLWPRGAFRFKSHQEADQWMRTKLRPKRKAS